MDTQTTRNQILTDIQLVCAGHQVGDCLDALITATALVIATATETPEKAHQIADLLPKDIKQRLDATWPETRVSRAAMLLLGGGAGHG